MRLFRRRKFILDKKLQLGLLVASLCYVAFYLIATGAALFLPVILELRASNPDSSQAYVLAKSFLYLHGHFWPVALLSLVAVALHSVLLTHKVAGPLYRFRRIFAALKNGTVPGPQRLRRGDFLETEMQLINEMLESFRSRLVDAQEAQAALNRSLADIARRTAVCSDEELKSLVRDLEAQGERFARLALFLEKEPDARDAGREPGLQLRFEGPVRESAREQNRQGYSLAELLIALAIVATVAGIAIPSYTSMVEKAKVVAAIGDIKHIQSEIDMYQLTGGVPPNSLKEAGLGDPVDPWHRPYQYLRILGIKGKSGAVRKDKNLVPLNSDYDLYSLGRDGVSAPPITAKQSHDDIIRANNGGFVGLASNY